MAECISKDANRFLHQHMEGRGLIITPAPPMNAPLGTEVSSPRCRPPARKVTNRQRLAESQLGPLNGIVSPCLAVKKRIDDSPSPLRNAMSNSISSEEDWKHLSETSYDESGDTQARNSVERRGLDETASFNQTGGYIDDQISSNKKRVCSSPTKDVVSPRHSLRPSSPITNMESAVGVVVSDLDLVVTRLKEGIGAGIISDSTTTPIMSHYKDDPTGDSELVASPSITLPEIAEQLEADLIEFKKAAEKKERAEKDRSDAEEKWRSAERQKIEASVRSETSHALFEVVGRVAAQQLDDNGNLGEGYIGECTSFVENNLCQGCLSQDYSNCNNASPANGFHNFISCGDNRISGISTAASVKRNEINAIMTLKEAGVPLDIINEARRTVAIGTFTRKNVAKQLSAAVALVCNKAAPTACAGGGMAEMNTNEALIVSEGSENLIDAGRQISDNLDAAMKRLESILPSQRHKGIPTTTTKSPLRDAAANPNPKEITDSTGEKATSIYENPPIFWDKVTMNNKVGSSHEQQTLLAESSNALCHRDIDLDTFQPANLCYDNLNSYVELEGEEEEDYLHHRVVPPPASYPSYPHAMPSDMNFKIDCFSGGDFPVFSTADPRAGRAKANKQQQQLCCVEYPYACTHHHHFSPGVRNDYHCSTRKENPAISIWSDRSVLRMVKPSAPPAPSSSAEQRALASSIAKHSHENATERVRRQQADLATFFSEDKIVDRQFKLHDDVLSPMDTTYNKLASQGGYHHSQEEANCKHELSIAKSDTTLEGAAMLAARRNMNKEAVERLHPQARQNNSAASPRALLCQEKGDNTVRKIEREGYSASSSKLAEYKLMRQTLVSSII